MQCGEFWVKFIIDRCPFLKQKQKNQISCILSKKVLSFLWYGMFVAKEHQTMVQRDFHFFMLNFFLIFQYIHILKILHRPY